MPSDNRGIGPQYPFGVPTLSSRCPAGRRESSPGPNPRALVSSRGQDESRGRDGHSRRHHMLITAPDLTSLPAAEGRMRERSITFTNAWRWLAVVMALARRSWWPGSWGRSRPDSAAQRWTLVLTFGLDILVAVFMPWLLLANRVPVRRLIPGGVCLRRGHAGGATSRAGVLPRALEESADQYGSIGVAFTYLAGLYVMSFIFSGRAGRRTTEPVFGEDEGRYGIRPSRWPTRPTTDCPQSQRSVGSGRVRTVDSVGRVELNPRPDTGLLIALPCRALRPSRRPTALNAYSALFPVPRRAQTHSSWHERECLAGGANQYSLEIPHPGVQSFACYAITAGSAHTLGGMSGCSVLG